jgi:hypothetical protein
MLVDGAVHEGRGVISSQVCQKFCNVMLHKLTVPIPTLDLKAYLESTVYPLIRVFPFAPPVCRSPCDPSKCSIPLLRQSHRRCRTRIRRSYPLL